MILTNFDPYLYLSQRAGETYWAGDGLLTPAELKEGLQKA